MTWTASDLAHFTALALALAMREHSIVGVITNPDRSFYGQNENEKAQKRA